MVGFTPPPPAAAVMLLVPPFTTLVGPVPVAVVFWAELPVSPPVPEFPVVPPLLVPPVPVPPVPVPSVPVESEPSSHRTADVLSTMHVVPVARIRLDRLER